MKERRCIGHVSLQRWRAVCARVGGSLSRLRPTILHSPHHICHGQKRGVELEKCIRTQTITGLVFIQGFVSLLGTCTYKRACVRTGGGMWPVHTLPQTYTPNHPPPALQCYLWAARTARTGSLMRAGSALLKRRRLRGSAGYCKSPFIAFPRDFLLCTPNPTEGSQSSFLEPRRLQKGNHPPRAGVLNRKPHC